MFENKTIQEVFTENLKYYARKNNKKQADIARDLDYSTGLVSDWFNGIRMPRTHNVDKLASYFGISSTDLYSKEIFHEADNVINSLKNMVIGGKPLNEHNLTDEEIKENTENTIDNILHELYYLDIKDLNRILRHIERLINAKENE